MGKTAILCSYCDSPTGDDTYLCGPCTDQLKKLLVEVPELVEQLDVTLTRQSRIASKAETIRRTSDAQPLPYDLAASDAHVDLWQALASAQVGYAMSSPVDITNAIQQDIGILRGRRNVGSILKAIQKATDKALRVIDLPETRWWWGTCLADLDGRQCQVTLRGEPDDVVIQCPVCGATHETVFRRLQMVDGARSRNVTIPNAIRWISQMYGTDVPRSTLWSWVERGHLAPAEGDGPQARFHLGTVEALWYERMVATAHPVQEAITS